MAGEPHGPARDRSIAAQARNRGRRVAGLGDEIAQLRASPEYTAMRRFARVHGALAEVLPEPARGKVRAIAIRDGTCTLSVANAVLCAELRAAFARRILDALALAGTGTTRLVWRVERS